jgi:hypothetical protein
MRTSRIRPEYADSKKHFFFRTQKPRILRGIHNKSKGKAPGKVNEHDPKWERLHSALYPAADGVSKDGSYEASGAQYKPWMRLTSYFLFSDINNVYRMKIKSLYKVNFQVLLAGIISAAALRAAMSPYPNIEPVMLFTLAAGLAGGPVAGFLMGAGTMIFSNILMAPGPLTFPWLMHMPLVTAYTALTYGVVGIFAGLAGMVKKSFRRWEYAALAAALTLFYDLVTCVCFALQFYGPSGIPIALAAQIPFTVLHLSNAVIAFIFAPYVHKAALKAGNYSIDRFFSPRRQNA